MDEEVDTEDEYLKKHVKRILKSGNLYTALNLTKSASFEDVEESYSFLSYMVDESSIDEPDYEKAIKVLDKAYETLTDPQIREYYDCLLQNITADDYQPTPTPQCSEPEPDHNHNKFASQFLDALENGRYCIFNVVFLISFLVSMFMLLMVIQYADSEAACDYYYDILGVSRGSTTSEIKMAYRQLAKKLHPDRKALEEDTDGKQFGELVEAYKVLSNSKMRKEYDMDCEYGIANYMSKTDYRAGKTKEGFRKYGIYSICLTSKWCVHMYYNVWLKVPTKRRVEENTQKP